MKLSTAQKILRDPERYAHHDRIFLNNPTVMQGMGLAPLVVLATSGKNALMLAVAVALLLTPSRLISCLLSRCAPLTEYPDEEQLGKKLLPRGLIYCGAVALVYLVAYQILSLLFGTELLALGIYLPLLCVEPLLIYRFARVQEIPRKALSKGLRITVGYAVILLLLGCIREFLAAGTVFGLPVMDYGALPVASMPAGGFILLGVVCAVWRAIVRRRKDFLVTEARNLVTVNYQQKEDGKQ